MISFLPYSTTRPIQPSFGKDNKPPRGYAEYKALLRKQPDSEVQDQHHIGEARRTLSQKTRAEGGDRKNLLSRGELNKINEASKENKRRGNRPPQRGEG